MRSLQQIHLSSVWDNGKPSELAFSLNLTLRMTFWLWPWRTIILKTSAIKSDTLKTLLRTLEFLKSDHGLPRYATFTFTWWPSWIVSKKWVKGEKIEPYGFNVIWSFMMLFPPLTKFGQTDLAKLHLSLHCKLYWHFISRCQVISKHSDDSCFIEFHWLSMILFNTLRPRQNGCYFADKVFKLILLCAIQHFVLGLKWLWSSHA